MPSGARAAAHDRVELRVHLGGRVAEIGQHAGDRVQTVARETVGRIENPACGDHLRRRVDADRRRGRPVVTERSRREPGVAADAEGDDAAMARFDGPESRRVDQTIGPAPAGHHGDLLHAVDEIGHRRCDDSRRRVELPELQAVGRPIRRENPVGASLENEVAGRREHAAPFEHGVGNSPSGALLDRVPCQELTRGRR